MATAAPTRPAASRPRDVPAPPPHSWGTEALLVLMATIWGANYIVVKVATHLMTPLAFTAARVGLAAVVLAVVVPIVRERWPVRRDVLVLLALGVLGNGLYQVLFIEGIARTRAGTAALVLAAAPAFVAIIGRVLGVERVTARRAVGIAASLVGIALVVFGSGKGGAGAVGRDASTLAGNLLVLGACLCWSTYTVLLKPYAERIPGVPLSAVTMIGGAIPMALVAAPEIARTAWPALPIGAWGALAYSGLLALALAYLFWYRGVRVIGPTRTAMYGNLQPAVALVVAWLALGETPTLVQGAGAVAILAGILLTRA